MVNQIFILGVTFFCCRKLLGPFFMILGKSSSIYDTGNILFEKKLKSHIPNIYIYIYILLYPNICIYIRVQQDNFFL